ncbi:MAG: polysaccharide deacetylase family protein [Nitrososphaeraceae archaeon]
MTKLFITVKRGNHKVNPVMYIHSSLLFVIALSFFLMGYLEINNNNKNNLRILTLELEDIQDFADGNDSMLNINTIDKDIFYHQDSLYHYFYAYDNKKHSPTIDFDGIQVANAQEQKKEKNNDTNSKEDDKYVILVFDRGYKTTFTKAKPILDKYDFKATIFITCSRAELDNGLNWDQLRQLHLDGHDIQSHGAEHKKLVDLKSYKKIESVVRDGKKCLQEKGFNPTAFQAPFNKGGDDPKIIDIISRYFDFAFFGHAKYMFLNCDGWENFGYGKNNYQGITNCNPYFYDGEPKPTSRYAMKEWSHDREHDKIYENKFLKKNEDPHGKKVNNAVFKKFVKILERQTEFNKNGEINAIPIVTYHRIDTNKDFDTSRKLFEMEMEYLHENNYKVIRIADLEYDENQERFYVSNVKN